MIAAMHRPRRRRWAKGTLPALAAALLAFAGPAAAQTLRLQNLAPFARSELAAVVVPFARGDVADLPRLAVPGRPTVWQPFGARWPDGSLRQALCLFPADVPALGEAAVALEPGAGEPLPDGDWEALRAQITFEVQTGDATVRAEPQHAAWLERNGLRRVELLSARLGSTGLVAELILAHARGAGHAYADAAVFFSDPRTEAMQCAVKELAVESRGMALLFRHAGRLGVEQATTATGSRAVLLRDAVLGDGQGLRRCGALVPPLRGDDRGHDDTARAAAVCPLLGATSWRGVAAFGAFGEPPPLPPWLEGPLLRGALAQRHRAFAAGDRPGGDPFGAPPLGLAKNAGQTGDQNDFGVVKLSVVAGSGLPSFLLEVEASVLQAACRPVHFFEASGEMVRAADRPDWIVWSGRTHWHEGVSPDRLGKPHPEPRFEKHGWTGKDRQHWSTNHLGAFAQLTGAHWARRELSHEVQLYLSGQTVDPVRSTSGAGAPRGAGRTLLAATWLWLATGDQDLLRRMNERLDRVYGPQWAGKDVQPGAVRTMAVASPDARMLQGATSYWTPWQDALAAVGFAAAHRVTGNDNARMLAEELALTVVRHGFLVDERQCIVATAMRWQDGEPLSPAQIERGGATDVLWSHGTAFTEWSIGAVEIARVAALDRGDEATAARAAEIQRRVRAGRQRPRDGFVDRLTEWDAVVWEPAGGPGRAR